MPLVKLHATFFGHIIREGLEVFFIKTCKMETFARLRMTERFKSSLAAWLNVEKVLKDHVITNIVGQPI